MAGHRGSGKKRKNKLVFKFKKHEKKFRKKNIEKKSFKKSIIKLIANLYGEYEMRILFSNIIKKIWICLKESERKSYKI